MHCRDQEQEAEGEAMQQDLHTLADDLVQKFEDQWKGAAENLDAASKAFDNLEGETLLIEQTARRRMVDNTGTRDNVQGFWKRHMSVQKAGNEYWFREGLILLLHFAI